MNGTTMVTVPGKPKLLDRMRHAVRVRHMARSTENAYVYWCRRDIPYHNKRRPAFSDSLSGLYRPEATDVAMSFARH